MRQSRRQVLQGLLSLPFLKASILEASAQKEHHASTTSGHSRPSADELGSICLHFEGVFGYLVYSNFIEIFTPNLPSEHDYCFGMGGQRFYGFPPGDFDLRDSLPNVNGQFKLTDKSKHLILSKSEAEISSPDFSKRYWRIKVPIPSDIVAEGDATQVKQPFSGKQSNYVNQITQMQVSYKFIYTLDAPRLKKLHLRRANHFGACLLEMRYCVRPKIDEYAHAVSAFKELTLMLPKLDLDMKPDIGHPKSDAGKIHTLDEYVFDGHLYLCTAPSIFVTGM